MTHDPHDPHPAQPLVSTDRPYPRATLTPPPDTLPAWARVPAQPDPADPAAAWAMAWNSLVRAYFAARRALAAAGPDAIPLAPPDDGYKYTQTELFARAADAAELSITFLPSALTQTLASAIATLAYADAVYDRSLREQVPLPWPAVYSPVPNPDFNPFKPGGSSVTTKIPPGIPSPFGDPAPST